MNWSSVAIFLALLFTTAHSQRGGRRYVADQPLEENLSAENHRFQTRSRDVEDSRRGEGRRARIQDTTELNSRSFTRRSRVKSEEPRQFHSRSGKELDSKLPENKQILSRRTQETDTINYTSRGESRNERFKSRESNVTTEKATRNQNSVRSRTRAESRDVEYKTRGTETNRFTSRGTQDRGEPSKISHDFGVGELRRSDSRDRSQVTRKSNVIDPPRYIDPVTERFHSRQQSTEEIQISKIDKATELNPESYHHTPITEGKIQDFTSKANAIDIEKRTRLFDDTVTEKFHLRQLARQDSRKSRVDSLKDKNDNFQVSGRKKSQDLPTRGSGTESRRRRPTDVTATDKLHSRQLTREEFPAKRSRFTQSTEKIRSNTEYAHKAATRRSQDFMNRGSGIEKQKPYVTSSTERFHSRQSPREKSKYNRIDIPTTESNRAFSSYAETEKTQDIPTKEINAAEVESRIETESVVGEPTTETKTNIELDNAQPITKQPDPLSTENTVDFPIKSNDVEEPNRISRKLEPDTPERNSYHRSQNRDFENTNRGRLESSLSRERSRSHDPSIRVTEGRRVSRRFSTPSPDISKDLTNENKGRRNLHRLSSRTKNKEISNSRGRHKLDDSPIRSRTSESPIATLRYEEKTPETVFFSESVSEGKTEDKIYTETQIQNDQKNEVTTGVSSEISITSTQRTIVRNTSKKSGNRGRGQIKAKKAPEENEHSGEVRDDDNYPEVYKQLKKSGTDPKDILV